MTRAEAELARRRIAAWPEEERRWFLMLLEITPKQALRVAELVAVFDAKPVEMDVVAFDADAERIAFAQRAAAGRSLPPPEWFELGRKLGVETST